MEALHFIEVLQKYNVLQLYSYTGIPPCVLTEIAPSEYPKQLIVASMFKSDLICEFSGIFTESTTIQSLASLTEIVCQPPLKD